LQGTLGLISWSGRTMAYTWMLSLLSEQSQRTRDSLVFRISASCSRVKLLGQPPFSYQNRLPSRKLWNCLPQMNKGCLGGGLTSVVLGKGGEGER